MNTKRINNKLVELDSIKKKLNDAGIHNFYEIENKKLLIQSSDSVKITLEVKSNTIVIKPYYFGYGDKGLGVILFIVIILLSIYYKSIFWGLPILTGLVIAYFFLKPKISKLEYKIKNALGLNNVKY